MIKSRNYLKFFLLISFLPVLYTGCSSDDKSPPKAGFSISEENPVQWDVVTLTDKSEGSTTTGYQITGGEFIIKDDLSEVVFLEAHTYTITQVTVNDHGEDTYSLTIHVVSPDNRYLIDGQEIPIISEPDREKEGNRVRIRFINEVAGQQYPDYVELFPIPGSNPLEATYLYDGAGKNTGTYLLRITKDYNKDQSVYEWTMDFYGNDGDGKLIIDLIYEDRLDAQNNVYDISIENYTLSTGRFDFPSGSGFIEEAKRSFSVYYRGRISH
jgi:hypothetical protein